uniref:Uncharacterized protein n=1 Tax=Arundo donax TaxID=35708 RepID=A0A0A9C2K6_ARUDO
MGFKRGEASKGVWGFGK